MNNVSLTGNLTKDLEVKETSSKKQVVKFTLAVADSFNKEKADFISCVAWNKTAETMGKYLKKGSKIGVTGRIQTGSYEKDGNKVYTTEVVVGSFEFLDSKKSAGNDAGEKKEVRKQDVEGIKNEFPF